MDNCVGLRCLQNYIAHILDWRKLHNKPKLFDHAIVFIRRDNYSIERIGNYFDCLEVGLNKNLTHH